MTETDSEPTVDATFGPEPSGPAARASGFKLVLRFFEAMALGFIGAFVVLAIAPVVIGWRPYTVLTGSMRPNIDPGDVVMDRRMKIADAKIGDVITFSDPGRDGALVTHRIRSITFGPVSTDVETRGDANNTSERWSIKTQDSVGRVVYVIPKVGHLANDIRRHPAGILLLVVIPVLLLGIGVVRWIWKDDDERGDGADDDELPSADGEPPDAPMEPTGEEQGADDRPDR